MSLVSEQVSIMSTRTGRTFRGRLTDHRRDELLLRIVKQLESLTARVANQESRIPILLPSGMARGSLTANENDEEVAVQDEQQV